MSRHPFYDLALWPRLRRLVIARDAMTCQACGTLCTTGRKDPRAAVVDHIRPFRGIMALFKDPANLWLVCKSCHDSFCQSIEARLTDPDEIERAKRAGRRRTYDDAGKPQDPSHPWNQ